MGMTHVLASEPGSLRRHNQGNGIQPCTVGNSHREAGTARKTPRLGWNIHAISYFDRRDPRDNVNRSHTTMHRHDRGGNRVRIAGDVTLAGDHLALRRESP